ncbi:accessory gland protein Acp29AB-like [Drosophila ficusphila]|uniref:accessory gland protein Acp29AB-like n=1 Tax=Drosophila ficusphila TaxID=30025 RepID=UPI001C8A24CD|nr:accessory gland protein Acp29AB-like [Drosophila ficusphila]
MFEYAVYLLYALLSCDLYGAQECPPENCFVEMSPLLNHLAQEQEEREWSATNSHTLDESQGVLDRIEGQQVATATQLSALQARLESRFKELRAKLEQKARLISLEKSLEEAVSALQLALKLKAAATSPKLRPQEHFEVIEEYQLFFDPHQYMDWFAAAGRCSDNGGYLAAPVSMEELHLIAPKLGDGKYWLDISDLAIKDKFTSLVTGAESPLLNWQKGEPNNNTNAHCVYLQYGQLYKHLCQNMYSGLCQFEKPQIGNAACCFHNNNTININININRLLAIIPATFTAAALHFPPTQSEKQN